MDQPGNEYVPARAAGRSTWRTSMPYPYQCLDCDATFFSEEEPSPVLCPACLAFFRTPLSELIKKDPPARGEPSGLTTSGI